MVRYDLHISLDFALSTAHFIVGSFIMMYMAFPSRIFPQIPLADMSSDIS